jgi:3D (Asp-Asp-Asp) domain-containing protein
MEASAYTASCNGCSGITATGIDLKKNPNTKVISVDPSVIPLGSKVNVEGYGVAIAGDTGGAIKGNRIDVFIPNKQDAINFGRKQVKVTILD